MAFCICVFVRDSLVFSKYCSVVIRWYLRTGVCRRDREALINLIKFVK